MPDAAHWRGTWKSLPPLSGPGLDEGHCEVFFKLKCPAPPRASQAQHHASCLDDFPCTAEETVAQSLVW